jgi:hypothetical protein
MTITKEGETSLQIVSPDATNKETGEDVEGSKWEESDDAISKIHVATRQRCLDN